MLQNAINNGIQVNGISANGSKLTVVADGGLDLRMRHDVAGKPLPHVSVPKGQRRSEALSSHAFAIEGCSTERRRAYARVTATTWPTASFEPPAAAWASLVIHTAISL